MVVIEAGSLFVGDDKNYPMRVRRCSLIKKRVVLVARDIAPSACFKRLVEVLEKQETETVLIVGNGLPLKETLEEISLAVSTADVVILGMSSTAELAEVEVSAGETARRLGIPYGFYGDCARCWARARAGAWFESLAPGAQFYFGVTQADAEASQEVFPNARLVGTGNPLREDMFFPRFSREEVRTKLGLGMEKKLVLAHGGKFAAGNMVSWVVLVEALSILAKDGHNFQLILSLHPGDRTPEAVDRGNETKMNLYEELVSYSPIPTTIVRRGDELTTSDLIAGADIIVGFGGSPEVEGACQNIPVISLSFEVLAQKIERECGRRVFETVDFGTAELVVADATKLAERMRSLLTSEGFALMAYRQREVYPKPTERGAAIAKMAKFLGL